MTWLALFLHPPGKGSDPLNERRVLAHSLWQSSANGTSAILIPPNTHGGSDHTFALSRPAWATGSGGEPFPSGPGIEPGPARSPILGIKRP